MHACTDLMALADRWDVLAKQHESRGILCRDPVNSHWLAGMSEGIADCATELRQVAAAIAALDSGGAGEVGGV